MKRLLKADLHIHSNRSFDSVIAPEEIVEQALKCGLDVIGVTDHGTMQGALDTLKLAGRKLRVLVGQETKTKGGDILVFNVDQDLEQGRDLVKTVKLAREMGGFIIVPHPFDPMRQVVGKELERVASLVDAIEGFNPKCFFERSNKKAEEFAQAKGLPAIASSDAHRPEDIGIAYTTFSGGDVLEAIRSGEVGMFKKSVGKGRLLKRRAGKIVRKRR